MDILGDDADIQAILGKYDETCFKYFIYFFLKFRGQLGEGAELWDECNCWPAGPDIQAPPGYFHFDRTKMANCNKNPCHQAKRYIMTEDFFFMFRCWGEILFEFEFILK